MRQAFIISLLVIPLLAAWAGSLYVAQDWGYKQGQQEALQETEAQRRLVLCQDALERRIKTEGANLNGIPFYTLTSGPAYADEAAKVLAKLASIERDIAKYCTDSQPSR